MYKDEILAIGEAVLDAYARGCKETQNRYDNLHRITERYAGELAGACQFVNNLLVPSVPEVLPGEAHIEADLWRGMFEALRNRVSEAKTKTARALAAGRLAKPEDDCPF